MAGLPISNILSIPNFCNSLHSLLYRPSFSIAYEYGGGAFDSLITIALERGDGNNEETIWKALFVQPCRLTVTPVISTMKGNYGRGWPQFLRSHGQTGHTYPAHGLGYGLRSIDCIKASSSQRRGLWVLSSYMDR